MDQSVETKITDLEEEYVAEAIAVPNDPPEDLQQSIEPCGFDAISMEGYLTDEIVERVRKVLTDPQLRSGMVDYNYRVARQFFSYDRVETELAAILSKPVLALTGTR